MSSKLKIHGSIAEDQTRLTIDQHKENFEHLKAHYINQQEVYVCRLGLYN